MSAVWKMKQSGSERLQSGQGTVHEGQAACHQQNHGILGYGHVDPLARLLPAMVKRDSRNTALISVRYTFSNKVGTVILYQYI